MSNIFSIGGGLLFIFSLTLGVEVQAGSSDEVDGAAFRPMKMECNYLGSGQSVSESVAISQTTKEKGEDASVVSFTSGPRPETKTFTILPGQFAECLYPSGTRVRVKVGIDHGRAYGKCGGNPEQFVSVWVNQRKVVSKAWFAGHCWEEDGTPELSYRVFVKDSKTIEECRTPGRSESEIQASQGSPDQSLAETSTSCVDYPDHTNFPIDSVEYPLASEVGISRLGDIEILNGFEAVCRAALTELSRDFSTFSNSPDGESISLVRPEWTAPSVELAENLQLSEESDFDFNNDGKIDRVFISHFENNYMDGSILLVQAGSSATKVKIADASLADTARLLPCQLDSVDHAILDCPPYSQKSDDASFSVRGKSADDSVTFRVRYSTLSPFSFDGVNYLGVSSKSADTENYVAILKPLPNGSVADVCLLRKITENF